MKTCDGQSPNPHSSKDADSIKCSSRKFNFKQNKDRAIFFVRILRRVAMMGCQIKGGFISTIFTSQSSKKCKHLVDVLTH